MGGIDAAYILPRSINSSEEEVSFLTLAPILTIMFGATFTQRLQSLVGSPGSSDKSWNILTLDAYLHRLYEMGLVGFRPRQISYVKVGGMFYPHVHFTIHWIGKTKMQLSKAVMPGRVSLASMIQPLEEFHNNRKLYHIFDCVKGTRIPEGAEVRVLHSTVEQAQMMHDCLTMSWAIRMIMYLAGGAGTPDGDPSSDEYYHEEIDYNIASDSDEC